MNSKLLGRIRRNQLYYLLVIPGLLYFLIFHYIPMLGLMIAFKDVAPFDGLDGILTSDWVGLRHFKNFINSYYFWNILGNTVIISAYKLVFGFPLPIVLALLINEVRHMKFKKVVQTISYMPHFISMVVLSGLVTTLLSTDGGFVNAVLYKLGFEPIVFLSDTRYFRSIIVGSGIWKEVGWSSIIYLAAIASVDQQLYEAAKVDGASRLRQIWHITLPSISFIIVILFILQIGSVMDAGFEQIFLLYSPAVYQVADIIDTYVYRKGLIEVQYSFAAAVGMFKAVIAIILVVGTNYIAKKRGQEGIW
ncbi:ABC transporter permease [Paenibacillus nasutitermitis]|uniref:Protein LplB n=1 Tax=Paenibacillus nasutitermitis TaxID=1652958 RepID=A0A916YLN2_9BACL|nr:ABC transporter permease subunit [Paenibacillus nasutitermitis]GGD51863.1 protein LplB [Paenibacillus nasutitermitis]